METAVAKKRIRYIELFERGQKLSDGTEVGDRSVKHYEWDDACQRILQTSHKARMPCMDIMLDPVTGEKEVLNCKMLPAGIAQDWFKQNGDGEYLDDLRGKAAADAIMDRIKSKELVVVSGDGQSELVAKLEKATLLLDQYGKKIEQLEERLESKPSTKTKGGK